MVVATPETTMTRTVCCRCGVNLTLQERTYYGTTCNGCEGELFLAAEEHQIGRASCRERVL